MGKLTTLFRLLKEDRRVLGKAIALNISASRLSHILSDKAYVKLLYKLYFDKKLNLRNPETFNEKLQWIKLYERCNVYTQMVDKHTAKQYAAERIGSEHIIPTYKVWDTADDINFDELPDQFVMKCTHDSGSIVICRNKAELDWEKAIEKMRKGLTTDSFYYGREWPYKDVKPKIIVEKLLVDTKLNDLRDFKFFCFNGKAKCLKVDFGRYVEHRANYYDLDFNILPFGENECPPNPAVSIQKPGNFEKMIEMAEELAKNTSFLRVDFYNVEGQIYFGEMTFFPASGFGTFTDDKWDSILGSWIEIKK